MRSGGMMPLLCPADMDNMCTINDTRIMTPSVSKQHLASGCAYVHRRRARTTIEDFVKSYFPYHGLTTEVRNVFLCCIVGISGQGSHRKILQYIL